MNEIRTMQAGRHGSDISLSILSMLPQRLKPVQFWYAYADILNPLGHDISEYQGDVDAQKMRDRGVMFIGIRASLGLRKDVRFAENWKKFGAVGMRRFAYHALFPNYSIADQVKLFHQTIGDERGELPPCWDIERRDGQTNKTISDKAYYGLTASSDWYGSAALGYSSKYYADSLMGPQIWYNNFWWYLARYLYANPLTGIAEEHPGPPLYPNGVDPQRCLIHQTAGQGQGGTAMGVESKELDYDRWQFDLAHLVGFSKMPPETSSWYKDIDAWARSQGFASPHAAPVS